MKLKLAIAGLLAATSLNSIAFAQDATDTPGAGEIVVTAQKREQSLQDVSAAVSAVGGDQLAAAQIDNLEDLQTLIPSISIGNDFNQAKLFVRGVGANTSTTGSSTGVALHVDGVYIARAEAQLTSLFDLERVEVVRGPQGSLYGRNAVGGSVNLITAKPSDTFEGNFRASYGNYNALTFEAAVGGPLADWVRFRIAGKTEDRDGFGRNPFTGTDVDDLKRRMVRGHLQFLLSPDVDFMITGEYFKQDDASGALKYFAPAFPGIPRLAPLGGAGIAPNRRDLAGDVQPSVNTETYAFTGTLNIAATDNFSITNITNYRDFKTAIIQDLDASQVINGLATTGQATTVQRRQVNSIQYSNELQMKYDSDILTGVFGLFYFHERQTPRDQVGLAVNTGLASNIGALQTRPVGLNGAPPSPALAGSISLAEALALCGIPGGPGVAPQRVCLTSDLRTDAFAAFGQANIDLGNAVGLTGVTLKLGGRYSIEDVSTRNPSIIIAGNGAGPIFRTTSQATFRNRTFRDFTPELGLQWAATDDLLLYYTYSEGFKAGSGENAAGSTIIVRPETVKNHELGIKAELFDRKLAINLAGFSYKLDDLQINKTVGGGPAGFTTIFENAAQMSAKGVELEFFARPTDWFRFSGGVSYIDSKFDDFLTLDPLNPVNVNQPAGTLRYNPLLATGALLNPALPRNDNVTAFGGPCGTSLTTNLAPCNVQLAGNRTRNTPEWSYSLHAEVDLPLGPENAGTFTLAGDMSGRSEIFFTEFARLSEGSRSYTMFDAWLRWRSSNGAISVQGWVKNIANTFRPTSTFAVSTGRLIGATYLPPRTYGISVGYTF